LQEGPAAKRQHLSGMLAISFNHFFFFLPESFFPISFENFRWRHAEFFFNNLVNIDEFSVETCCQFFADCRFSGSHKTDKDDIFIMHMYTILSIPELNY